MAFNLTRREGEALRVSDVLIEISKIREHSVILRITAPDSIRVVYKELSRNAQGDCNDAHNRAIADLER